MHDIIRAYIIVIIKDTQLQAFSIALKYIEMYLFPFCILITFQKFEEWVAIRKATYMLYLTLLDDFRVHSFIIEQLV